MIEKIRAFLQREIDSKHIPGAVVHVSYQGEIICREAIGNRAVYPTISPMQIETVFDLASLTKVIATLPAILKLIDRGDIRLDDPVHLFLPAFLMNGKEKVTIRHLLTHTAGFPAHRQFYRENLTRNEILHRALTEPLEYEPGSKVVYSDLSFITLYQLIEIITDEPFDVFINKEIFTPLEMGETTFNPTNNVESFAVTEYSEQLGDYKRGIVHDENAYAMNGISGHAGLFSTIGDMSNFARMIENNGIYKGHRVLSESVLKLARQNHTPFGEEYRGLGWMLKSPKLSSCGDLFSSSAYGHTGFTGTSIWFDPEAKLHVILLTNRVHYGREPHIIRLRARLHNLIRASI